MEQPLDPPPPGRLVVISGPSGVGKTTLLRLLLERVPNLRPSVSATTRPPREGERDGEDYHFLDAAEFERRRAAGLFLECCRVYGRQHWYGTLVDEVVPRLAAGAWVVLEIDVEGTLSIIERFPDAVTIFVAPPERADLERRLRRRGTETPEAMARRLEVAHRELDQAHRYRFCVVNDESSRAIDEIVAILRREGLAESDRGVRPARPSLTAHSPPHESNSGARP